MVKLAGDRSPSPGNNCRCRCRTSGERAGEVDPDRRINAGQDVGCQATDRVESGPADRGQGHDKYRQRDARDYWCPLVVTAAGQHPEDQHKLNERGAALDGCCCRLVDPGCGRDRRPVHRRIGHLRAPCAGGRDPGDATDDLRCAVASEVGATGDFLEPHADGDGRIEVRAGPAAQWAECYADNDEAGHRPHDGHPGCRVAVGWSGTHGPVLGGDDREQQHRRAGQFGPPLLPVPAIRGRPDRAHAWATVTSPAWSRNVRLSSRCQSSTILSAPTCWMSNATKSISWPLPCIPLWRPVKCPRNRSRTASLAPATRRSESSQVRSGTALRKLAEAATGPGGPCGRPGGRVLSTNDASTACVRNRISPVFQKVYSNWAMRIM